MYTSNKEVLIQVRIRYTVFLTITILNLKLLKSQKTHRCRIVKTRHLIFDVRETATSKPKILPSLIPKVIRILKGNNSYILLPQIRIERCRFTHLVNPVSHDGGYLQAIDKARVEARR